MITMQMRPRYREEDQVLLRLPWWQWK